jgi:hypothetical protein
LALKHIQELDRYPILRREGYYALQSPRETDFAVIDLHTTLILKTLQDLGKLRFQAVIQRNTIDLQGTTADTRTKKDMVEISINLYGTQNIAKKVGVALAREKQFLQHPDVVDPGVNYDNPHYFKTPGLLIDLNQCVQPYNHGRISKESIPSEVEKILDSLSVVDSDVCIPTSNILLTSLLR